jgi:dienelactone hydrolase
MRTHPTLRLFRPLALAILAWLAIALPVQAATNSDLVEEKGFFTVTIDGRKVRLERLIVKPKDAPGRLPVALITHGKQNTYGRMLEQHATEMAAQARDMAHRGWLAVTVMRRGFGASDGPMPVPVSCRDTSLLERFEADADDLEATLDVVRQRPDADPDHIIAMGASAGGVAVTALGARNPKGLVGIINLSGGLHFDACDKDNLLVEAMADYGKRSRVPSLWIYAQNDSLFGPKLVHRMHDAFLGGGADVKLVSLDPIGRDGHMIFDSVQGRDSWLPELDAFLRYNQLPTYQYREAGNIARNLKTKDKYLAFVEMYVSAPGAKALAQSRVSGALGRAFGYSDMAEARKNAIRLCQQDANNAEDCDVVMENNVWIGGATAKAVAVTEPARN